MASDFEKMKEEFDALRKSDFLGDDLDIELSDSSLDGYDDDFELQSPKVSTDNGVKHASGSGLKRTYTADLLGNIENELQKGLNLLSEEQKMSFKTEVERHHEASQREKTRRKTEREIASQKLMDKLNNSSKKNILAQERPSTSPKTSTEGTKASVDAAATRQVTVENEAVHNDTHVAEERMKQEPAPGHVANLQTNDRPQYSIKNPDLPTVAEGGAGFPTEAGAAIDTDQTIRWSDKQLQSIPTPNHDELKPMREPPGASLRFGNFRSSQKTDKPFSTAVSSTSRMSFSLNPDYINKPQSSKAKYKMLRRRQTKLSLELHGAFRANDLSLADKINRKLVRVNNQLIECSGKMEEVVTNITLADNSYKVPLNQSIRSLTSAKPVVPTVAVDKSRSLGRGEMGRILKPIDWYSQAKSASPLFKKNVNDTFREDRDDTIVRGEADSFARNREWLDGMQKESWSIVNNLHEQLRDSRMNDSGNRIDIINGAQYKRLVNNYNQTYSYVKGALDIYLEKEAKRLAVEPTVLNEVQTLIRRTATEMGIDYEKVMKKKRRPQSALPLSKNNHSRFSQCMTSPLRSSIRKRPSTATGSRRRRRVDRPLSKISGVPGVAKRKRRPKSAAPSSRARQDYRTVTLASSHKNTRRNPTRIRSAGSSRKRRTYT